MALLLRSLHCRRRRSVLSSLHRLRVDAGAVRGLHKPDGGHGAAGSYRRFALGCRVQLRARRQRLHRRFAGHRLPGQPGHDLSALLRRPLHGGVAGAALPRPLRPGCRRLGGGGGVGQRIELVARLRRLRRRRAGGVAAAGNRPLAVEGAVERPDPVRRRHRRQHDDGGRRLGGGRSLRDRSGRRAQAVSVLRRVRGRGIRMDLLTLDAGAGDGLRGECGGSKRRRRESHERHGLHGGAGRRHRPDDGGQSDCDVLGEGNAEQLHAGPAADLVERRRRLDGVTDLQH